MLPHDNFLDVSAGRMLDAFGAGRPTPGSGSAAALNGALACELIGTIAIITIRKEKSPKVRNQCQYVLDQTKIKGPALRELVQYDSDIFQESLALKHSAKKAKSKQTKAKLQRQAKQRLQQSTESVLRIAEDCVTVARLGLIMMEIGYEPAKGDPASGISNALAGINGAFCAAMVNLKASRKSKWAKNTHSKFQSVYIDMLQLQAELLRKVTGLKLEVENKWSDQLDLL